MLCNAVLMVRLSNFYSSFKPNFSRNFYSSFKLFENQTVRLWRVHCTFMISQPIILRARDVSDKRYRDNQNTSYSITFFCENRAVYEIMWKETVDRVRPQMTIQRIRFVCWITRATKAHSEYVIIRLAAFLFVDSRWYEPRDVVLCTVHCMAAYRVGRYQVL
jgi:hypothetical protein